VALRILKNLAANPEALKKVLPTTPALLRVLSSSPDMQTQNQAWEVLGVLVSDLNVTEALRNFVRQFFKTFILVYAAYFLIYAHE